MSSRERQVVTSAFIDGANYSSYFVSSSFGYRPKQSVRQEGVIAADGKTYSVDPVKPTPQSITLDLIPSSRNADEIVAAIERCTAREGEIILSVGISVDSPNPDIIVIRKPKLADVFQIPNGGVASLTLEGDMTATYSNP